MALRCAVLVALVVCSSSFRKNAHRMIADAPDDEKKAQGADQCSKLVAEFSVDIMNRMMAAAECGMEQDAIQKDHTISAKGTEALCSQECQGRPEFVKKLPHIEELEEMCTDKASQGRLKMAAQGYVIAKALKAAWEPCQEDPGIDVPFTIEDEPLEDKDIAGQGGCTKRLKAFQAEVMAIVVNAQKQCGISFPGGNTDSVTLENMCTADCQKEALGPPPEDIDTLKKECTDKQEVAVLEQTQRGYEVAQKILETWNGPCPDPQDGPAEVFDPILFNPDSAPVKPVVDLGALGLDIEDDLGCGPKTTAYVDHMLELVYDSAIVEQEQKAAANATTPWTRKQRKGHRYYLSCNAACYSVYTKFSECAEQDSAQKCMGAGTGRSIKPKAEGDDCKGKPYRVGQRGQYRENDAAWLKTTSACPSEATPETNSWLQKLKHGETMPCSSMYLSSAKASRGSDFASALSSVQRIRLEVLAAKHFIKLAPKAAAHPPLDCRYSYCTKVDKLSKNDADHRSLGSCVAQCAEQYLEQ